MHDDRSLVEARLKRVLDERIRPAVYPESVPLEVAVWHAPGEPVPVAEGLAADPSRSRSAPLGCPLGHQLVPGHRHRARGVGGPDRRGPPRPRLRREHARLPVRGPGLPARRHPGEGPQPAQPVGARRRPRRRRRARCCLHIEAASNPVILDYHALPARPRWATRRPRAASRSTGSARMDLAVFDETVWELVMDLEVLGELMAELPVDVGAPLGRSCARSNGALDAVDLQDVNGTRRSGPRAAGRGARRARRPLRPPHQRRRPRAHRLRLAVAAARDGAQGGAYDVEHDRAARGRAATSSSPCRRPSSTPGSRSTGPRCTRRSRRPSRTAGSCRPAACGWSPTPTCRAPRRWPVSSCTASGSSSTSSASRTTRRGCPTPSASPPACRRSSRRPGPSGC